MIRSVLTTALQALTRHAALVLAIGVFAGLVLPDVAVLMRPLLPPSVAGLLFLALLRIDWQELARHVNRPLVAGLLCVWFLLAVPAIVWAVVRVLPLDEGLATALILAAACPPIVSGPAMALLLRLDAPLMLVSVISASLAAPFTIAAVSSWLVGVDLNIDALNLFFRLAALTGACMLTAALVKRVLGAGRLARWRFPLDLAALVLLLVFAVAIMAGVSELAARDPGHVLHFVGAAFVANVLLQMVGTGAALALGRRGALTVGFASGNRNMGLLLAVLPAGAAPDAVLFFALGQLPIYMLPALLAPLYRRWLPGSPGTVPADGGAA